MFLVVSHQSAGAEDILFQHTTIYIYIYIALGDGKSWLMFLFDTGMDDFVHVVVQLLLCHLYLLFVHKYLWN